MLLRLARARSVFLPPLSHQKQTNNNQKKATEYHLGQLKARLAKLRTQLQEPSTKGGAGEGFDVQKYGDGRVALIGFPSVGKSSLLTQLTGTEVLVFFLVFLLLWCMLFCC